jgi:hypothetical protein
MQGFAGVIGSNGNYYGTDAGEQQPGNSATALPLPILCFVTFIL